MHEVTIHLLVLYAVLPVLCILCVDNDELTIGS